MGSSSKHADLTDHKPRRDARSPTARKSSVRAQQLGHLSINGGRVFGSVSSQSLRCTLFSNHVAGAWLFCEPDAPYRIVPLESVYLLLVGGTVGGILGIACQVAGVLSWTLWYWTPQMVLCFRKGWVYKQPKKAAPEMDTRVEVSSGWLLFVQTLWLIGFATTVWDVVSPFL